jgi:hypothetical protein
MMRNENGTFLKTSNLPNASMSFGIARKYEIGTDMDELISKLKTFLLKILVF